jgi:signal transduction histidine kinase
VRGIALKIFLSFWLVFAVLIASFAIVPDQGTSVRFADHVQQNGVVASALLEGNGDQSCADFSAAVAQRTRIQFVLFDGQKTPVCHAPGADLTVFAPYIAGESGDIPKATTSGAPTFAAVQSPSGATFTAAGAPLPGFDASPPVKPPFPYGTVGLAILVSGIVCLSVARYLARPLQQVRDVSYRLAAGDLHARVGSQVAGRRDEIGDLVRDFDAMASRIEALIHSQSQLLSDISHELRSPLARLNVALELARRKAGPDAQGDLERIEGEADRMNDLIGRVLALARAEGIEALATTEPVDLVDVVRHVAEDADYEAQRQQKSVALRVAAWPSVNGDARLIASAVDNVVRNAIRYTPERSTIDVVVDRTDGEAVISVRDHGPGVPASEIERIFSRFHRVEPSRNRETGGVGLGLAIAQRAISVHGGRITAENAADGGLRVIIRLPMETPHLALIVDPR